MITVIEVMARNVYGSTMLYPANDQAKLLAAFVGTKTLTLSKLLIARQMGFEIVVTGDTETTLLIRSQLR